ncbi:MAG: glycoside hydrolase family 3 N-terminal domain-containing protein, partial [Segatella copri]
MATYPIERLSISSLTLSDGPNGLRIEKKDGNSMSGISNTLPSTCFPSGVNLASSFDKELIHQIGNAIAEVCVHYDVNIVLGPAINIKRNPLGGRNFEYYSEDPLLSGVVAAAMTQGVQSIPGCGTTIKHFACNNQEDNRMGSDSILS